MKRCIRCNLPESYETLEIGADGTCNLCKNHATIRADTDWSAKKAEFSALIESHRGRHPYDCIVPFSGGKDSTWTLYRLMTEYRVKPLVVQFDHGFLRPHMADNNRRTLEKLGCDFISFRPNWHLVRRVMLEALIRRGDFCLHCHLGIFAYPMHVAIKEQTPLVIWGEPSTEYTAYYNPNEPEEVDEVRFNRFVNLGMSIEDVAGMIKGDFSFDYRDLTPFSYPDTAKLRALGVRSVCLGSYEPWDTQSQVEVIRRELGWEGASVEGLAPRYWYSKGECSMQGVRDYIKWLKRGYGRTAQMCATDVRMGRMEPEEARALGPQYDGERPASLDRFLDILGLTEAQFRDIIRQTVVPPHEMPV